MRLILSDGVAERIRHHGAQAYPHECCGALLGRESGAMREVLDVFPIVNRRDDSPQNRFSLSVDDFRGAEKAARDEGLELLGWYHSHPDHPARPSEYDREHAWPWYSYIIVRVEQGEPNEMASWRLADDRTAFRAEPIEFVEDRRTVCPSR